MFRAFYVGITRTHILTFNSVVMVLANAVLNYALIFGKFGFPAMGIAGAATASSAAELFSVLFYCIYTRCRSTCTNTGLKRSSPSISPFCGAC